MIQKCIESRIPVFDLIHLVVVDGKHFRILFHKPTSLVCYSKAIAIERTYLSIWSACNFPYRNPWFIHLSSKYFLSTYYVPGSLLGAGNTEVNKQGPCPIELTVWMAVKKNKSLFSWDRSVKASQRK